MLMPVTLGRGSDRTGVLRRVVAELAQFLRSARASRCAPAARSADFAARLRRRNTTNVRLWLTNVVVAPRVQRQRAIAKHDEIPARRRFRRVSCRRARDPRRVTAGGDVATRGRTGRAAAAGQDAAGSVNQNVDPSPSALVKPISPPWAAMISCANASPSPVPPTD